MSLLMLLDEVYPVPEAGHTDLIIAIALAAAAAAVFFVVRAVRKKKLAERMTETSDDR